MKRKNISGRSILEVLGVLAIIGVLSIGVVAGYQTAIQRHQVNEIIYQLNMMAQECSREYISKGKTELCEVSSLSQQMDYATIATEFKQVGEKNFITTVSNLNEGLCAKLSARLSNWDVVKVISGNDCSNGSTNTLVVQFKNDFSRWKEDEVAAILCSNNDECSGVSFCQNGACKVCDVVENCQEYNEETCLCRMCAEGYNLSGNACTNCPAVKNCTSYSAKCLCEKCSTGEVTYTVNFGSGGTVWVATCPEG